MCLFLLACSFSGRHPTSEQHIFIRLHARIKCPTHICVLILSNGVTASALSVTPAPNPAMTFAGPETLPSASASRFLYVSKATKRMPALSELPMMSVVQPAYHCGPNGGQGSFLPSASRRFSCVRVFANSAG